MDLKDAIQKGDLTQVEAAVARERRVASGTTDRGLPYTLLATYHGQHEIATLLADAKPSLSLHEAAALGRLDEARAALVREPLSRDAFGVDGFTPLMLAAFFGRRAMAQWLLEQGAAVDPVARNEQRVTALHAAAAGRHEEIVGALLQAGADPNARQQRGWTPLHQAADAGDVGLVRRLLAAGADPSAANDDGVPPAETAAAKGHAHVVRALEAAARTQAGPPRATGADGDR